MVAWELTRGCNLACVHCRASAERGPYPGELSTQECLRVMDEIASLSKPIILLTGGEPLLRPDIFDLARYGTDKGFRMVMATNGTLMTEETVQKMKASGIQRISVSLDGPSSETHDAFRKVNGAFESSLKGIELAKRRGLEYQINTTITQMNLHLIADILKLAVHLGAVAHHIFLLVPTGRGKELQNQEISALDYEKTLNWFYEQRERVPLQLKATCAPHYYRILRKRAKKEGKKITPKEYGLDAMTRGCLGGISFCFLSHKDAHPGGCERHHMVFNKFGVIPEYCFDCYKVLIAPRTVIELFKLLMVFEKLTLANDNTRKCMVEGKRILYWSIEGLCFLQRY